MTVRALCIASVLGACQGLAGHAMAQSPAPQPSFDCAKATARIERMICTDPELAQWDGRMGEAYKQKYTGLVGNDRRALIEDQRRWLASRNAKCSQTELAEAKSCILQFTKARFSTLQQYAAEPLQSAPLRQANGDQAPELATATLQDAFAANSRGDYATAFSIFYALARSGNALAQCGLGTMYDEGHGMPQDHKQALRMVSPRCRPGQRRCRGPARDHVLSRQGRTAGLC